MSFFYPLMLDVSNRLIVIVGGGLVGGRKARGLVDAGAGRIRVVSLEFTEPFPENVEMIHSPFEPAHLRDAGLVFACTDNRHVNDAVVREARRLGVLVNRADVDDDLAGDFSTPALYRDGSITIAVATSGVPGLATDIRDELAKYMQPGWVKLSDAMAKIRPIVKSQSHLSPGQRRDIFKTLASSEAMHTLEASDAFGLWNWLKLKYPELADLTESQKQSI